MALLIPFSVPALGADPDPVATLAVAPPPLGVAMRDAGPLGAPQVAVEALSPLGTEDASSALLRLARLSGLAVEVPTPGAASPPWLADAPDPLRPALGVLWGGVEAAQAEVAGALAPLEGEAREDLMREAAGGLAASQAVALGVATPEEAARAARLLEWSARVDRTALVRAELNLLQALDAAALLMPEPGSLGTTTGHCATGTIVFETSNCMVVVGGIGSNVYTANVILLVDEGGEDEYRNNAGGTRGLGAGVGVLWDRGADDDVYDVTLTSAGGVQGGGYLGAGLLVDEGGSDDYRTVTSALSQASQVAAQGSGIFGAGVLWDRGVGDDEYESRKLPQGVGLIGHGLLLDEGGSDSYLVTYTFDSEGGQGTGCYASFGALVDQRVGVDVYDASIDDMQGFGCLGGLGVLYDGGGGDHYVLRAGLGELSGATVVQSGWGQAYGELGAVGILFDEGGDDVYEVLGTSANSGQQTQGAGIVGGVALLADRGGNDTYVARTNAQGFGGTAGLGILWDAWGVDGLTALDRVQGAGVTGGVGVLLNDDGADEYHATTACQGWASLGQGLLLDQGGEVDVYDCGAATFFLTPRGDGLTWISGTAGVGVDR